MRVERDARMLAAQKRLQGALAGFNRLATQILAIELEQVEGAKDRPMAGPVPADQSNTARPLWSVTIASPSMRQERAGSAATAAAARGKRPAKS
jgi:hypothetical protein